MTHALDLVDARPRRAGRATLPKTDPVVADVVAHMVAHMVADLDEIEAEDALLCLRRAVGPEIVALARCIAQAH